MIPKKTFYFDDGYNGVVLARSLKHAIRIYSKVNLVDRHYLIKTIKEGMYKTNVLGIEHYDLTEAEAMYYITDVSKSKTKLKSQYLGWNE